MQKGKGEDGHSQAARKGVSNHSSKLPKWEYWPSTLAQYFWHSPFFIVLHSTVSEDDGNVSVPRPHCFRKTKRIDTSYLETE